MNLPSDFQGKYESHSRNLENLSRRLTNAESSADDLIQETWVALLQRPPKPHSNVPAWMKAVMRNLAIRSEQTRVSRRNRESKAARSERTESHAHEMIRKLDLERIRNEVGALDEPYRTLIRMRYFENKPPRIIAQELGQNTGTIKSQIHRGLERLRQRLESEYGSEYGSYALLLFAVAGYRKRDYVAAVLGSRSGIALLTFFAAGAAWIVSREETQASDPEAPARSAATARPAQASPQVAQRHAEGEEVTAPDVTEPKSFTVSIEVRDETGSPLAGASIEHLLHEGSRFLEADASGRASLEIDEQGLTPPFSRTPERSQQNPNPRVGLIARYQGVPSRVMWLKPPEEDRASLILEVPLSAPALRGRVLSKGGIPIVGVSVRLQPSKLVEAMPRGHRILPYREATTDADGRYEIPSVFEGYGLEIIHEGYAPYFERLSLQGRDTERTLRLTRGFSAQGRVRDYRGQRIVGATVEASAYGRYSLGRSSTDEDGFFSLERLPLGVRVSLTARKGALTAETTRTMHAGDEGTTNFEWNPELERGERIRIRIWRADGSAFSNELVHIMIKSRPNGGLIPIHTDEMGRLSIELPLAPDDWIRILPSDGGGLVSWDPLATLGRNELIGAHEVTVTAQERTQLFPGAIVGSKGEIEVQRFLVRDTRSGWVNRLAPSFRLEPRTYDLWYELPNGYLELGTHSLLPGDQVRFPPKHLANPGELRIDAGDEKQALRIYAKSLEGQFPWKTLHGSQTIELLPGDYVIENEDGVRQDVTIRSLEEAVVVFAPE